MTIEEAMNGRAQMILGDSKIDGIPVRLRARNVMFNRTVVEYQTTDSDHWKRIFTRLPLKTRDDQFGRMLDRIPVISKPGYTPASISIGIIETNVKLRREPRSSDYGAMPLLPSYRING